MTDEIVFEGITQFPSRPHTTYRYKLTASSDSMSVWLEDRVSKHQWASGLLQLSDFVDGKNSIAQASVTDYASCFNKCLESKHPKSETDAHCSRDSVPLNAESWSLQFVLVLKVDALVWQPTFEFTMKPVKLEPIDIIATKLLDMEEKVKQLEASLAAEPRVVRWMKTAQCGFEATSKWFADISGGTSEHSLELCRAVAPYFVVTVAIITLFTIGFATDQRHLLERVLAQMQLIGHDVRRG